MSPEWYSGYTCRQAGAQERSNGDSLAGLGRQAMNAPPIQESALNRPEAVLAGLLHALGRGVYRTKLVKLTYLLDESNYRLRGRTMTGFEYMWDNYGPNAEDNRIVRELDQMGRAGVITMRQVMETPGPAYLYKIGPCCDPADLPLSSDDWVEIHTTVHKYGKLTTTQVVKASKATAPMCEARQYGALVFAQAPPLTPEEVDSDPFWQETLAAIDIQSDRISLDDLRSWSG